MLRVEGLGKRFGDVVAVDGVAFEAAPGELITLLGPSGCGKTTTLRMIAGFEQPTAGRILLRGRDVTTLPPQRRGTGMVFQNYALFPHLDVFENVAFGLKTRRVPRAEIRERVGAALARVDLEGYAERKVQELSGGQQQRVALARALAPEPPVLLLDEPLSNLDAALRERTRSELRALLKRVGITSIFVTHDQEEAFGLADRIALMNRGRLQQIGTPEELYHRPVNTFVASFLGRANFLPARILGPEGDALRVELPGGARWLARPAPGAPVDGPAEVMIRPESLRILPAGDAGSSAVPGAGGVRGAPGASGTLTATVLERRFAGAVNHYRLEAGGAELLVQAPPTAAAVPGDEVRVRPEGEVVAVVFGGRGGG